MNELEITLTDINPQEFFGNENKNLELLKFYFPKLKIIGRGNKIIAFGETNLLNKFKNKVEILSDKLLNENFLDAEDIERHLILSDEESVRINNVDSIIIHGVGGKEIKAKTENQLNLVKLLTQNDMVFAVGPAGTGKTYTGVAMAVKALKEKKVKRIILTRPAVEAGENLGFLPGDLKEKLDPYMQPLYDALKDMIPIEKLKSYIEKEIIQIAPLAFMRGRTLDNAFVILDEAQNTSHSQMKMFLTRMGKNAKFMITGDPGQVDLPRKIQSGLIGARRSLKTTAEIGIVYWDESDVMRHKIVKKIIDAYKKNDE